MDGDTALRTGHSGTVVIEKRRDIFTFATIPLKLKTEDGNRQKEKHGKTDDSYNFRRETKSSSL